MTKIENKHSESVSFATNEEVAALGSAIIEENRDAFEELAK